MITRACLDCGTPTAGTRCEECRLEHGRQRGRTRDRKQAHQNTGRWKALSKRLRRAQQFCTTCGVTSDLAVDHIISIEERPELTYAVENLQVLCRPCNGRKGNRPPTDAERAEVERRLAARRVRNATSPTRGATPDRLAVPSASQRDFPTLTTGSSG